MKTRKNTKNAPQFIARFIGWH